VAWLLRVGFSKRYQWKISLMACLVLIFCVYAWIVIFYCSLVLDVHSFISAQYSPKFVMVTFYNLFGEFFWNLKTWWRGWFPLLAAFAPLSLIYVVIFDFGRCWCNYLHNILPNINYQSGFVIKKVNALYVPIIDRFLCMFSIA
jgi:hypothetical protein